MTFRRRVKSRTRTILIGGACLVLAAAAPTFASSAGLHNPFASPVNRVVAPVDEADGPNGQTGTDEADGPNGQSGD